ncbi:MULTISPECIES: TetR/AcrR family transcriptional regulator [unclassified Streptomyces]|uniref:TetR/AcrR family transcriptional regulator n=1 Tax=unclassified Streptomyces TaxID=2593676 RepID=UPI001BEC2929|nr:MULTISPECIES: TetR/AcrR family transcriptional regulator [unclassified Streptomyces]MBT2408319.1 TetR family transcriptional regulator [Streptomyces sp. ISL-21]MBT2456199.1 TetR family transcriptional regulator [Streptomyces sp. ISL-86]MBT2613267.1 TetR family transcriptional regulator [Streptomyces sp. ISL-87]
MENTTGLRENKKLRTRRQLAATALELFLERGFDAVSVADVAAAAEVSKPTLFRYFPSKEDLVLDRFADHQDEAARIVRDRDAGQSPVGAVHAHFLAALAERDPITGLCDHPNVVAFQRLLYSTTSLETRLGHYTDREVELLAAVLEAEWVPALTARLAALHLVAVRHELGRENWRRIESGLSAEEAHPAAVTDADRAFTMLASGLDDALPIRKA